MIVIPILVRSVLLRLRHRRIEIAPQLDRLRLDAGMLLLPLLQRRLRQRLPFLARWPAAGKRPAPMWITRLIRIEVILTTTLEQPWLRPHRIAVVPGDAHHRRPLRLDRIEIAVHIGDDGITSIDGDVFKHAASPRYC